MRDWGLRGCGLRGCGPSCVPWEGQGDFPRPQCIPGHQLGVPAPHRQGRKGPDIPSMLHIYPSSLFFLRCLIFAAARGSSAQEAEGTIVQEPLKPMYLLLLEQFPMPCSKPQSTRLICSLKLSLLRLDPPYDFHCVKKPQRPWCIMAQISFLS